MLPYDGCEPHKSRHWEIRRHRFASMKKGGSVNDKNMHADMATGAGQTDALAEKHQVAEAAGTAGPVEATPGQKGSPTTVDPHALITELLADMGAQKDQLLAIIDFCREERTSAEIDEMLAPYQEYRKSVYTPINIRSLLEGAGALTYISHDEAPEEVRDEEGNLVIPENCGEGTWLATDAAIEVFEEQDPFADLVHTLDDDEAYLRVYLHILNFVSEKGRSISEIEHDVAESGLIEDDKRQPGYFVGKLEDIGALEWRGVWTLSDLGRQYLALSAE